MERKRFIFILGNHKSGTTLLRSLFDNHSEISVIPIETHPFYHMGFPIKYALKEQISQLYDVEDIIRNFINWVVKLNEQQDSKKGGNYAYGNINTDKFIKMIWERDSVDFNSMIYNYLSCLNESIINSNPIKKYIVEKSVENFEFAETLSNYFSNSKFIHIIRNPYSNIVSLRKYFYKYISKYPNYRKYIKALQLSHYYAERNMRVIKNYTVIKYEDLIGDLNNTINKLVEFLDIPYEDTLKEPTVLSKFWTGNSVDIDRFKSIKSKSNYLKDITDLEIKLVNKYLKDVLKNYNYEKLEGNSLKSFIPKYENCKYYCLNRTTLYGGL